MSKNKLISAHVCFLLSTVWGLPSCVTNRPDNSYANFSGRQKDATNNLFLDRREAPASRPSRTEDELRQKPIPKTAGLQLIEGNSYRTTLAASVVFRAILRTLSQTYPIQRVDKANMTLTTEWDKFFIDNRLFRNRFIISIYPIAHRRTEVSIRNHLEYYTGNSNSSAGNNEGAWLPSPDITDEVTRLVENVNGQFLPMARRDATTR